MHFPLPKGYDIFLKNWLLQFLSNVTQTGLNSAFVWDYFQWWQMNTVLACQYVQQQQCMIAVLLPACPVWLCGSLMDFSKSFWTQWHRRKVKLGVCYAGNTCFFREKRVLHLLFDGQGYPYIQSFVQVNCSLVFV